MDRFEPTFEEPRLQIAFGAGNCYFDFMKTTIDIPDDELSDAMRFTRAKTKREAVVMAVTDFNRRRRMMDLVKHAGTCTDLMTVEELQAQRRQE